MKQTVCTVCVKCIKKEATSKIIVWLFQMCAVCTTVFTPEMTKHHCRACGEGVCAGCSTQSKAVPERGWSYPVRVCDHCARPPPRQPAAGKDPPSKGSSPSPQPWVVATFPDTILVVTDQETSPNVQSQCSLTASSLLLFLLVGKENRNFNIILFELP